MVGIPGNFDSLPIFLNLDLSYFSGKFLNKLYYATIIRLFHFSLCFLEYGVPDVGELMHACSSANSTSIADSINFNKPWCVPLLFIV